MAQTPDDPAVLRPARDADTAFFGHPRGLSVLFFSEMWERFSYYGMRAILALFMNAPVEVGGLGFSVAKTSIIYGIYTAMVYLLGVPGGWIADKFLGLRKGVLWGGVLIMLGHVTLAIPAESSFFAGLVLVMLGTGLLKPNISTMVGQLYTAGDVRRDSGFSLYYMGINLGAFIAPLACGYLGNKSGSFRTLLESTGLDPNLGWHFGFGMAAVGMAFGLIQYVAGWRHLGDAGLKPNPPRDEKDALHRRIILGLIIGAVIVIPAVIGICGAYGIITITTERIGLWVLILLVGLSFFTFAGLFIVGLVFKKYSGDEMRRLLVVFLLFVGACVFWSIFEQAGSTMNLFADRYTRLEVFGMGFQPSAFQSVNSVFVIAFAGVFAWVWLYLGKRNRDPSAPSKFGVAMLLLAGGMLIMVPAAKFAAQGIHVSPMWLVGLYLMHTLGELCLSPVGLSSMTKLAPRAIGGMVMGIWFLGAAVGNYTAGRMSALTETIAQDKLFLVQSLIVIAVGVLFFVLVAPIRGMLARCSPAAPE
jgi:POT family proton-dependent oligopeptide transporter